MNLGYMLKILSAACFPLSVIIIVLLPLSIFISVISILEIEISILIKLDYLIWISLNPAKIPTQLAEYPKI